ncbi:beta-CASP ribonuclease aCPSF1 [Candidatus Nitrosocosmicus hydrocola]|uniref:beta-CASP ribonuclease aCPSF1 n=1 Tax=Candidatus Nitrosocosmicus hydrocola TaxID=1826872 RepID=UPI000A8ADC76|nr:beta-CASP ribonuclease aCPSF1 [Candidatus Nitrosocosmicus hydrocola]
MIPEKKIVNKKNGVNDNQNDLGINDTQRIKIEKSKNELEETLIERISKSIPKEAQITIIKFEAANIALYTKNPGFALTELTLHLSALSKSIKKRFIIRTDPSIRLPEEETRNVISRILPKEVTISVIFCDEATGEVILEVNNPEGITSDIFIKIATNTGWIAHTRRSPHIPSNSIKNIHSVLKSSSKDRINFYQSLGRRIFRAPLLSNSLIQTSNGVMTTYQETSRNMATHQVDYHLEKNPYQYSNIKEVFIYCLGGVKQVGRSCFIVVTPESKIMLDCGINPGENVNYNAYPRIDWFNFNLDELDAVVISHAHIDHQGFLPALYKFGYKGPVYCTEPTLPLMTLLQLDSVKIAQNNGSYIPYEIRDVNEIIKHCIPIPYGKPTDISPDVTITLNNAGHIMGSATVHINISGAHNILYTGDYKYARTQLLDGAMANYPRVETIITESTYGASNDLMPDQSTVYGSFTESINQTLKQGGKVLIPVPAVGRAQEIMLVLDKEMREGRLIESPIFIEGMISEASAIHMSFAHYLGYEVRKSVSEGINPFTSSYFTVINGISKREEVFTDDSPSIIMATSGMLEGGPSVEYFKQISPSPQNKIIFVSYQINGTLGRRVLDGSISEASMIDKHGKVKVIPVRCSKQKIDGFSGHSDFNQIMNFVSKVRPKRVLVNHGERSKSENVASMIYSRMRIRSSVPDNREIIKLK